MRCNKEETRKPTLKNERKRMLGGLSDYAQTGCSEEMAKMLEKATCYFYEYRFGVFLHIPGRVFFKKWWSFYCK